MIRTLKLLHLLSFVLFLGSIITFVVISAMTKEASVADLAFGRRIISIGTSVLTLPGMWLLGLTGTWMGYSRFRLRGRFVYLKLSFMFLIIMIAYAFVVPAATAATGLAVQSASQGQLLAGYGEAYTRESIWGGVNVLLSLGAAIVGLWAIGRQSDRTE